MTSSALRSAPAPGRGSRAVRWARKNLFRTWLDSLLTVVFGALALYALVRLTIFVFVNARWEIIEVNLKLLMVGRWPSEEIGVMAGSVVAMGLWLGLLAGIVHARQVRAGQSVVGSMTPGERIGDLARRFGLIVGTVLLLLALTDTTGPWLMAGSTLVAGISGRIVGRHGK